MSLPEAPAPAAAVPLDGGATGESASAALGFSGVDRLGRYRLLEKLGQGGMATVYRAEDEELRRPVAIKLMHPFLADRKEGMARFVREARAVASLRHPNVLAVHDYVPEGIEHPAYLVMELIRGPSLRAFLDGEGAPLPEVAAMIGLKIAQALAAAHAAGIVHRDVKPENVMIDAGGRVVLCDFGIARLITVDSTMTATGSVIGSPAYMSPEQANGDELDHRSDLFSLGTVMYLVATGTLPFNAREPLVLLGKIHRGDHRPPSSQNERIPPYLERAIERCLKVSREERWQSAAEVAAALEAGLRSDGMAEVDRELAAYFASPPEYNAALEPRIVEAALAAAEAAARRGALALALGQCNRALAWRPHEGRAQALVRRLGRRGMMRRWLVIAGAAAVGMAVAGAGYRIWSARRGDGSASGGGAAALVNARAAPSRAPTVMAAPAAATANAKLETSGFPPQPTPAGVLETSRLPAPNPAAAPPRRVETPAAGGGDHPPVARPVARGTRGTVHAPSAGSSVEAAARFVEGHSPAAAAAAEPEKKTDPPVAGENARPSVREAPALAIVDGEVKLLARPYCKGLVDGRLAVHEGSQLRVAAGAHRVRCEYAGKVQEKEVTVVAGEVTKVSFDFLSESLLRPRLTRGDEVAMDEAAPSAVPRQVKPGVAHRVRLFKRGQEIDHGYVDVPPGECILVDAPRLECRKP